MLQYWILNILLVLKWPNQGLPKKHTFCFVFFLWLDYLISMNEIDDVELKKRKEKKRKEKKRKEMNGIRLIGILPSEDLTPVQVWRTQLVSRS